MRVLLIHGRAQGGKDPVALEQTWIDTLDQGLAAAGKTLPAGVSFDFPFYGDRLDAFTAAADLPTPGDVAAKGPGQNRDFEQFMQSALGEMYERSALTEADVEAEAGGADVREKGVKNWWWVQSIARAIDRHYPGTAESAIDRFLRDVYLYLNSDSVTSGINALVEGMLTSEPTVVVGHSLGTVVGYQVIGKNRSRLNLCKYVTVGSPLGIKAISAKLGIPENHGRQGWYNAYDERDIVALNPLDDEHFPTDPAIVNFNGVRNQTDNRHGIIGYLNDPRVAAAIADALRACA